MLLSHCNSSKWHNSKQCGSKEKKTRVQIRVAIKIYSFIHLFIQFVSENKQTSKENKQAITGRPMGRPTDRRRSTTDRRRPTADDRRPTADDRRPTADDRRPTADDRRSTIDDRRPTDRPSLLDDARSFGYSVGYSVFFHFDSRLSMSDDRLSTVENSIVIFVHFGAPYSIAIASK